jgi:hypothetical protein
MGGSGTILGTIMGGIAVICGLLVAGGFVAAFVPGLGNLFSSIGFASIYILPALMLGGLMVLQVFVFPLGFLVAPGVSDSITYPVMVIYNSLLIATVVQFIRG